MKQAIVFVVAVALIAGAIWFAVTRKPSTHTTVRTARVTRGEVVRQAVAVGRIVVEHEVAVKSRHGGVLTKLHVALGQRVEAGDPVAEVKPIVTAETILAAERSVKAAHDARESAREFVEGEHPAGRISRWFTGQKSLERTQEAAEVAVQQAEERLELLKKGEVVVDGRKVDYTVRTPVAGHVLRLDLREGAPVVPSSSYGSGTVLVTLGDLDRLVFRGTVDEIDVGRLGAGMTARLRVGALPEANVTGKLSEIELQGTPRQNAIVFGVRIDLDPTGDLVLRSGYSAVAEIDVDRRKDVLVVPERVVDLRDGAAFVLVPGDSNGAADPEERRVETGLSDGLTIEITAGLAEGDEVLERSSGAEP